MTLTPAQPHVDTQTEILIAPWVLQRHPQYWDKPDEFIPERWADDGTGSARLSRVLALTGGRG